VGNGGTGSADVYIGAVFSASSVGVGDTVDLTVQMGNNGIDTPTNTYIYSYLPPSLTYVSASDPNCTFSSTMVRCTRPGILSVGALATYTIRLRAVSAGTPSFNVYGTSYMCDPSSDNGMAVVGITIENPIPVLTSISPAATTAGSASFILTADGSRFVTTSQVRWNGSPLATTYVNGNQLTAVIPAALVASAGTASITVFNPAPVGGTSGPQTFTIHPAPLIQSFTANPSTIARGQTSTLSWATANATSVSINQGIGVVATTGVRGVTPTVTTTYTLTASNALGASVTQSVTVTVDCNPVNCPSPNVCLADESCVPPPAHQILSLTALPNVIAKGQLSTLSWTTQHATEVSLDQGIGVVTLNGSHTVSPVVTTVYTLTARNAAGVAVTQSVTVTVDCNNVNCPLPGVCQPDESCVVPPDPQIISFTATPDTIARGQGSTLAWVTENATAVSIDQGIGGVTLIGNRGVIPTATTVYTLTARNAAGVTVTRQVTVTLDCNTTNCPAPGICQPDESCTNPPDPIIVAFTATPDTIARGQTSTLSWNTENATDVSINQAIGVVSLDGSRVVSPTVTTVYTLTARNAAGVMVTQSVTVTIDCNATNCPFPGMCLPDESCVTPLAPVILSFTATPDTIARGQASTLAWVTQNATEVSIDQAIGSVALTGNHPVTPTVTTVYVLTARNAAGVTVTQSVAVTIDCNATNCPFPGMCLPDESCVTPPDPLIVSFTATPGTIARGQNSTLAWTTQNATEVSVNQGIGIVSFNDSRVVSPSVTTTYTLTARNAAGVTVSQSVTVTIDCNAINCPFPAMCLPDETCVTPPAPLITGFVAVPDTIAKGQNSTLSWTTQNASEASIDQGIGSVAVSGVQTVTPAVTTTYTLTARNPAGVVVTRQVTVTVDCNATNCPAPGVCLADESCQQPMLDRIVVSPDGRTVQQGEPLQFSAVGYDQFNRVVPNLVFAWAISGADGSAALSNTGSFRAVNSPATRRYTVGATALSKTGFAQVTVIVTPAPSSQVCDARAYPVPYKVNSGLPGVTFDRLLPDTRIDIYSADGREVQTLSVGGGTQLIWDLRNSNGDRVASGVYYYILRTPGPCGKTKGKLVLIL